MHARRAPAIGRPRLLTLAACALSPPLTCVSQEHVSGMMSQLLSFCGSGLQARSTALPADSLAAPRFLACGPAAHIFDDSALSMSGETCVVDDDEDGLLLTLRSSSSSSSSSSPIQLLALLVSVRYTQDDDDAVTQSIAQSFHRPSVRHGTDLPVCLPS